MGKTMKEPTDEQILEADMIFGDDGTPLWGNPTMLENPKDSQKVFVLLGCPNTKRQRDRIAALKQERTN
jgi:hypothetical protein